MNHTCQLCGASIDYEGLCDNCYNPSHKKPTLHDKRRLAMSTDSVRRERRQRPDVA